MGFEDLSGQRFGCRIVLGEAEGRSPSGDKLWSCRCERTGRLWVLKTGSIKRATRCGHCARLEGRQEPAGIVPIGTVLGSFRVVGEPSMVARRRGSRRVYPVECTRCGASAVRRLQDVRPTGGKLVGKSCAACRDKKEAFGKLWSYDELERVFKVKKSLLLHRQGRAGMALEEALLMPVKGTRVLEHGRICTACNKAKPFDAFADQQGRCNPCRSRAQVERRSLALAGGAND